MLFNTFEYFFFFSLTAGINFLLPQRFRVPFLLAASYFYYMQWRWEFVFLLAGQTAVAYSCGIWLQSQTDERRRKWIVAVAGAVLFGLLGYYKYYNFFSDSFRQLFTALQLPYVIPHLNILLPVGISFFTFQVFGYVVDIYRKKCGAERNFWYFGLFAGFFPQLAAGPIGRAPQLLPQFYTATRFDAQNVAQGLQMIIWGLFKKVVIADRLALYVNQIYGAPQNYSGASLLLATYFFTIQIYCDFSGYSDIAIGSAKILGYQLRQNFNLPYFSINISEFWSRWHIALSTWFRDYLYFPLGGNRVSQLKWMRNIFVVFLVSGLWHGASWTFVIWGGLHGMYYFVESAIKKIMPQARIPQAVKVIFTFHAVAFAWIFFRAASFGDALTVINRIGTHWGRIYWGSSQITTLLSLGLIILLAAVDLGARFGYCSLYFSPSRFPAWCRVIGYSILAVGIALLGITSSNFIYLQF